MNRSQSTISRELARNIGLRGYRHTQANKKAKQRHTNKPKAIKMTSELTDHIDMMLQQQWSPEQISGRLEREGKNSEIIGPTPQIAPKKHKSARLWQSGMWRCKRPIEQWCLLPVE
jgi:IS30 family transposase